MKRFSKMLTILLVLVCVASVAFGAALSSDRDTPTRSGDEINVGVAVSNIIYFGAIVGIDSTGYAVPASADSTLRIIGRANEQKDNSSGASGDLTIDIGTGIFRFINNGTTISSDDIGKTAYVVDDQTVDLLDNSGARPAAGRIYDVDSSGVWIKFATQGSSTGTGGITATDLGTGSVNTTALLDGDVSLLDMNTGSVNSTAILDGEVSLEDLDSGIAPSHIIVISNTSVSENDADGIISITHNGVLATDRAWGVIVTSTQKQWIINAATSTNTITFVLNGQAGANTTADYWVTRAAQ